MRHLPSPDWDALEHRVRPLAAEIHRGLEEYALLALQPEEFGERRDGPQGVDLRGDTMR